MKTSHMNSKEVLINEIKQVPDIFVDEVLDFVRFIKTKMIDDKIEATIASESSLKKDWLHPVEDEAWKNL